jgi:pyridinium-3,5-bisthiocarboxylic acid mononucleotide nickel chelatase
MILYLECASGVSGDMLVAALLSLLGVRPGDPGALDSVVRPALAAAGVDPGLASVESVRRGGVAALSFEVADGPGFGTFDELIASIDASDLDRSVAEDVAIIARTMAKAEAEVHGGDVQHLHELSNVDTVVDLISAVALVHHLSPDLVLASPPALGSGTIATAHGTLQVPAPAVLSLLAGLPTAGGGVTDDGMPLGELTTPTGAALVAHYACSFAALPAGRVERFGYGAGRRETPGRPNVLRAILIEPVLSPDAHADGGHGSGDHVLLETNVDDMSPELLAHAADALRDAGAVDVWFSQVLMKKGRPGVVLHVLASAQDRRRFADLVFAETSSFGLRVVPVDRIYAEDRRETVAVAGHEVGVRLSYVDGRLVTVSPEYVDVARASAAVERPASVVYQAAQAAARARFGDD